jgi:uncharacterized protein YwqG
MEIQNLDHLIVKHHLTHADQEIRALACQSIRLLATPAGDSRLVVGSSRLGGQPDLPDGFMWPSVKEKPMSFIAQICLEDIAGFGPAQNLPSSGTLSFFYDSSQGTYGASPNDRSGWDVTFFEPAVPLKTTPFPESLPQQARFWPFVLGFHSEWTLPVSPQQVEPGLQWKDRNQRAYEVLLREFRGPGDRKIPQHRMFGWPDQIQDDMQLQAAMMSNGVTSLDDSRFKDIARTKASWQLLFQVDSDERAGMRWASYGMIYDWITDQALKERQFNQTWLILQSD